MNIWRRGRESKNYALGTQCFRGYTAKVDSDSQKNIFLLGATDEG